MNQIPQIQIYWTEKDSCHELPDFILEKSNSCMNFLIDSPFFSCKLIPLFIFTDFLVLILLID